MNIYKCLNEITKYIDDNLEEEIDYKVLARILGVNIYTMRRLFTMLVGISLSEYIRKRRLSNAGYYLYEGNLRVMDVAFKYQYDNPTSFSRAFFKFHGIKPSMVTKETKLRNFPRIVFNEDVNLVSEMGYEIILLNDFKLYGISINTNNDTIGRDAPLFFKEVSDKYGKVNFGMITYDTERMECKRYYCLYDKNIEGFDCIIIPKSRWLKFKIDSQEAKEIQEISHKFYRDFLPSCKYNLKRLPELEYYHDGITDFLVPIS